MSTLCAPRTWEELFSISNLSDSYIPRDQMINGKIVGDYEMDPRSGLRPCGIAQCHTDHRRGYIVELDNGVRSYVGKDCGKSKFGADWQKMRKTFSMEKHKLSKDRAIRALRSGLRDQIDNWRSLDNKETAWARALLKAFDEIPDTVRKAIEIRANSADPSIFELRQETPEEVRLRAFRENHAHNRLPQPKTITVSRGRLRGLAALRSSARLDNIINVETPVLLQRAKALVSNDSSTPDELGAMSKELSNIEGRIGRCIEQLRQFVDTQNLDLLPFILALQQHGVKSVRHEITGVIHRFIISRT